MAVGTELLPPRYRGAVRIGRGGMGDIYRATDASLGRAVAIKVLSERYAQDVAVRDRFKREALAAARLSSDPNIVTIFDVGEWNERPFIVMEYLGGGTLDERVRASGAQDPSHVLEWLECAAKALDSAHAQGVVHRDVKPGNLLLDRNGSVHVADFGIASATGMDSLTATGTVLGTAGYLAPEQAQGGRSTPASDRYSLAVVAFELLTGRRPYHGDTPAAEAAAHVHAEIPSVSARRGDLPPELDAVFDRALAKDPAERYPTCADFVADLRHALHEAAGDTQHLPVVAPAPVAEPAPPPVQPVEPTPVPAYAPAYPAARRFGPFVVAILFAGLLIGGGLGLATLLDDDSGQEAVTQPRARTIERVRTVTTMGRPQRVTVTQRVQTPPPPATPPTQAEETSARPAGSVAEARRLNDQAFAYMNQGRYRDALPLAQQALARLRGTGDTYEAYAEYNVGRSLIELGNCAAGLPHIDRSQQLQGHRREFDTARAKCR